MVAVGVTNSTSPPNFFTSPDSYVNVPTLIDMFIAISIGITDVSKANSSMINSVFGPIVNLVSSL